MIYWIRRQGMGARRGPPATLQIDAGFLSQLREHVAAREVERGIACLRSQQDLIANLDPNQENCRSPAGASCDMD